MTDEEQTIEQLLTEATSHVARMPASPGARELRARLDQYRRVLDGWLVTTPTDAQRQALREQIEEVLRLARNASPTVKLRRPPTE